MSGVFRKEWNEYRMVWKEWNEWSLLERMEWVGRSVPEEWSEWSEIR